MNCRKILIVEDEPDVCAALQSFLGRRQFSVSTTPSGADALQIITVFQPDLIFLDITLLDLSGIEVLRQIREVEELVPVVIMTGQMLPETEINAIRALGIVAYLQKPVILSAVEALLFRVFEKGIGEMTALSVNPNNVNESFHEDISHKIANLLNMIRTRNEGFLLNERDGFHKEMPEAERLENAKGIMEDAIKAVDQITAALTQMHKKR